MAETTGRVDALPQSYPSSLLPRPVQGSYSGRRRKSLIPSYGSVKSLPAACVSTDMYTDIGEDETSSIHSRHPENIPPYQHSISNDDTTSNVPSSSSSLRTILESREEELAVLQERKPTQRTPKSRTFSVLSSLASSISHPSLSNIGRVLTPRSSKKRIRDGWESSSSRASSLSTATINNATAMAGRTQYPPSRASSLAKSINFRACGVSSTSEPCPKPQLLDNLDRSPCTLPRPSPAASNMGTAESRLEEHNMPGAWPGQQQYRSIQPQNLALSTSTTAIASYPRPDQTASLAPGYYPLLPRQLKPATGCSGNTSNSGRTGNLRHSLVVQSLSSHVPLASIADTDDEGWPSGCSSSDHNLGGNKGRGHPQSTFGSKKRPLRERHLASEFPAITLPTDPVDRQSRSTQTGSHETEAQRVSYQESRTPVAVSSLAPRKTRTAASDPRLVTTAQSSAYWTGRFVALDDGLRNAILHRSPAREPDVNAFGQDESLLDGLLRLHIAQHIQGSRMKVSGSAPGGRLAKHSLGQRLSLSASASFLTRGGSSTITGGNDNISDKHGATSDNGNANSSSFIRPPTLRATTQQQRFNNINTDNSMRLHDAAELADLLHQLTDPAARQARVLALLEASCATSQARESFRRWSAVFRRRLHGV